MSNVIALPTARRADRGRDRDKESDGLMILLDIRHLPKDQGQAAKTGFFDSVPKLGESK